MRVKRGKTKGVRAEVLNRLRQLEAQCLTLGISERLRQAFDRISALEEQLEQLSK